MTESGLNEFDSTPSFTQNVNTTETLRPQEVASEPDLPVFHELEAWQFPQSAEPESELQKIENVALSVVHSIEEKMEIISDIAAEGHYLAPAPKNIHVHLPAGGGSVIKNPG